MRRLALLSCVLAVFCTSLAAEDSGENKPYTQWTPTEVEEILTWSPWVKVQRHIPLDRYLLPTKERKWEGLLLFPRLEGVETRVTVAGGRVRLNCQLSKGIRLDYSFKRSEMVFGGKLEF